jgi:hypothetical protein
MQQFIPEHPASYLAEAAVILMIAITIFFMIKVWS